MDKLNERQAVSVIVRDGGRFLLVERANDPAKGMFSFPGGRVEAGESLEMAARRELLEETGLRAGAIQIAAEFHLSGPHGRFHLHVFLADTFSGSANAADDAASLGWYAPADMKAMPMPQSVRDVVAKLVRDET